MTIHTSTSTAPAFTPRTTTASGEPLSADALAFIAGRPVVELWGVLWMLSDARDAVNTGNASQHVAAITPLSDDGTRRRSSISGPESLTIRGRRFDANSAWLSAWIDDGQDSGTAPSWRGAYINGGGYVDAYTPAQFRELFAAVEPVALAVFPPLTHAERVAQLVSFAHGAGRSAARDAWRTLGPYGADIFRALTPAERDSIAAAMVAGFAERAPEGH